MQTLWRNVRFGARMLLRRPGFTAAAVLSLVLGIGLNTAIFTLLDAVFLRPLPVRDPESLAAVYASVRDKATGEYSGFFSHSHPNYSDLARWNRAFSGLALHLWWPMNFTGGAEPVRATGTFVTANYFDVLGLEPAAGRFFLPEEDADPGTHPVAVLSHGTWTRLFGGDPAVVGREVGINGRTFTVVGVAPRGFRGLDVGVDVDFFVPVMMFPEISPYGSLFELRSPSLFRAVGRLEDGVSPAEAQRELMRLSRRLEEAFPKQNEGLGASVRPLLEGTIVPAERDRHVGYGKALAIGVALILLMSCVNVASLLLLRGTERGREIAVRQSLGASRGRVAAQLLTENLLLFGAAGLLSLPAGFAFLRLLWRFRPPQVAEGALTLELDGVIFGFTLAVALGAGLVFGLAPALAASRLHLVPHLKESSLPAQRGLRARWLRPRRLLGAGQVALALVSLIAAGIYLLSLHNARRAELGFDAQALLALSFAPGEQGYDPPRARAFYSRVLDRVRALPGVRSAALSENRLLRGAVYQVPLYLDGDDKELRCGGRIAHRTNAVTPGFFDTAGIPLVRGSDFDDSIRADGPRLAIVNQTLADLAWPDEDPIGRRFEVREAEDRESVEVVGVVRDARYRHVHESPQCFVYFPEVQRHASAMTLHVRAVGDPAELLAPVRREVRALAPELPLADVGTLEDFVAEDLWLERASAALLAAFAGLALALATLGVYGVVARTVSQRRREMAVRMAVGARRSDVLRTVLAEGLALVAFGIALGLGAALALARLSAGVSSQLHDVEVVDPGIWAAAAAVLVAVALLGLLMPATRASRTDPARVLRVE